MSTEIKLAPFVPLTEPITIATASGLAKIGTRFTTPFDQHADREGEPFRVLGMVEPTSYDFDEVGPMYRIEFGDGTQIDAWPEEVEVDAAAEAAG